MERKRVMKHYEEHGFEHTAQYLTEDVNGKLVISLRDVSHTMRSLYEGKGSQKRVLMVLRETGTVTQRELTRRLGIQPGSASEVIAKLEHAGLVRRTASKEDRRTADISLTDEGVRQAERALEQRQRRHEEMFSVLTREEKEQLFSLLEKVNADWQKRYRDRRDPSEECRHDGHHDGDFADCTVHGHHRHGRHGGNEVWPSGDQEERHHCDYDCANCAHPCGRGRNRRA